MLHRRIPLWVRHAPTPGVARFAALTALDAAARGSLISVFPLALYRALQDPALVSQAYLVIGLVSLGWGLMIPWATRYVRRRWMLSLGAGLYAASALIAVVGGNAAMPLALLLYTLAAVTVFVSINAYVLDFVAQVDLGRCETLRMFYSALPWMVGPALGVLLLDLWRPAPFLISAGAALALLALFWRFRLGDGKFIRRAGAPAPNPLRYLGRFFVQRRLVAGWLFAVLRSCAWWVYVVYLPIFVVRQGLSEDLGGIALSVSNGLLFATPLMLRWVQARGVRRAVRTGFVASGAAFVLAALVSAQPWATMALLMSGSVFLVLLDICGGLPFLMAVKPSERTEMSAVYSSFRDVSSILTPGVAWLVLLVAPLPVIFAAAGGGLLAAWLVAGRLHPRLGHRRIVASAPIAPPAPAAPSPLPASAGR